MLFEIVAAVLVLILVSLAVLLLAPAPEPAPYFAKVRISAFGKVANAVLAPLDRLGVGPFAPWDLQEIKAKAMKTTGLSDFGGTEFEGPFTSVIKSCNKHSYSPVGKLATSQFFEMRMGTRLKIFDYIKQHPDVLDVPVPPPIFVMGLPRTGTTFLHRLLSLDPKSRSPLTYELFDPTCCTGPDERKVIQKKVQGEIDQIHRIIPHLNTIHETHSMLPEECLPALGIDLPILFCTMHVALDRDVKVLEDWDPLPGYKNYAKQLQIMTHIMKETDKRWTLKCPMHLAFTKTLREAFPGARLVWTHRDPVQAVASFASLVRTLQELHSAVPIDMKKLGADCLEYCEKSMKNAHEHLAPLNDGGHVNVSFKRIVKEPKEVVKDIYAQFDLEYSDEYDARLDAYLEENAKERAKMKKVQKSYHSYSMEDYGIPTEIVRKKFEWYSPVYLKEVDTKAQ